VVLEVLQVQLLLQLAGILFLALLLPMAVVVVEITM
jgi:hypothetical protein